VDELGAAGQERLCSSRVVIARHADSAASETASDYLARAGLSVAHAAQADGATEVLVPSAQDTASAEAVWNNAASAEAAWSGSTDAATALRACASYFAGAWAAVEAIKQCAEVGKPSPVTAPLVVSAIFGAEVP